MIAGPHAGRRDAKDTGDKSPIEVEPETPGQSLPFGTGWPQKDIVPGQSYEREFLHGAYQLVLVVSQCESRREVNRVVLKGELVLEKNSKTEIVRE